MVTLKNLHLDVHKCNSKEEAVSKSKWDLHTAKSCIARTGGSVKGGVIKHKNPGLKVLGAIDYLVGNHKHIWLKLPDEPEKGGGV